MYGMGLPTRFAELVGPGLEGNDTLPPNIDPSTISFTSELSDPLPFFTSHPCTTVRTKDDGHSITTYSDGSVLKDPAGWTIVETVLIRSANIYTPSGHFPVYSNRSEEYAIGCDAAVCVQKYEPWIIEASNTSTLSPSILRVVGRGDGSASLSPSGAIRGVPLPNLRYLNATGKTNPFRIGFLSSVYQLESDNGRITHRYAPIPVVGPPCNP